MVRCSMCMFEGGESLDVLKHIVRRHKNNPTFHVQCQFEGCASSYQKWDSYRKHLSRKHGNVVPAEAMEEETLEEPPPNIPPEIGNVPNVPEDMDIDDDTPVSAAELLAWKAGKCLSRLRDVGNCSQRAIDIAVEEVGDILVTYRNKIHGELKAAKSNPEDTHLSCAVIDEKFAGMKQEGLFDNVRSAHLLDKFQSDNGKVATEKVHIGVEEYWTKTEPPRVVERDVYAYTLPLKETLQQLLANPEILTYVLNPVENNNENVLKDVRDGAFFKAHALFSNDRHALIIIFYYDDLQTSNLAGSKPQKFSMFYWSLANVPPHLRSSLRAINLYAVVRTKYFRKFGASKILASFISDIRKLQTEGMKFSGYNGERIYRGSLLFTTCDTPAAQLLAGMKEGVGGAESPCRGCDATQETMQNSFSEADFTLRDKVTHRLQVDLVTDPTISREVAKARSKLYGINREGVFVELPDHDVTKCLVQDFMHVMLEGVLPLETRAFLRYVILEEHLVTRTQLNHLIKSFDYGHLKTDCPSEILEDHLNSSLKQNSLQHLALGHVLPFLLKPLVECHEGALERLNLLVTLLQICNLCLVFEVRVDDVALLEHMIIKHHTCFRLLYPDIRLTPKFHYMIHFPSQCLNFGPLRLQWCLRYEGAHLYFKRLMQVVLCYKNPPLTMCNRFSARRTVQLLSFQKYHASNFLDLGDTVSKTGRVVSLQGYPFLEVLRTALPALTANDSVMIVQSVTVKGTLYKEGCVILIRREADDFPQFGQVESVVVNGHDKVLLYKPLETLFFEQSLDAYKVESRDMACRSICVRDLPFPHPLSLWRCARGYYVILFNDVPEFLG